MESEITYRAYFKSPLGLLVITANEKAITGLHFAENKEEKEKKNEVINDCLQQLTEYFNRERFSFKLRLQQEGTELQQRVWNELQKIPYGMTMSYLTMARKIKNRTLSRAVGNASGKNNIAIIVPCHRLVGSNGSLTGYSGGIENKKWLLEFEKEAVEPKLFKFKENGKKSGGKRSK
ncbi:MAG: Methylated-DNA--protein-cysteine methyltransferase [Bacteroidia bacterium]|nr:Methylated-DNA--protein-cysteine methyltransferase [Bacteroidia bacterium]